MTPDQALRNIQTAKEAVADATRRKAELEGSRRTLMARLKEEFRIDTVATGEKRIDELEDQLEDQKDKLNDLMDKLGEMLKGLK